MRAFKQAVAAQTLPQLVARVLIIALFVSMVAVFLIQPAHADNTYLITDGEKTIVHTSQCDDPAEAITEAGLTLGDEDTFTATETEDGQTKILIHRVQMVTVICDDKTNAVEVHGETVGELVQSLGITLGEEDRLSIPADTKAEDGMTVIVIRVTHKTVEYNERVPYETDKYEDSRLAEGETQVLSKGREGKMHCSAYVTYENGKEVNRTVLSEKVIMHPIREIVLCAAQKPAPKEPASNVPGGEKKEPGGKNVNPELPAGAPEGTVRVLKCLATAYSCDGRKGITASGSVVHIGTVAVDPKVIPMGSKLYIVTDDGKYTYANATAEDTGGLIKGNRVDLYFNTTAECFQFGARKATVYILGK